jgi:hypothetical protein
MNRNNHHLDIPHFSARQPMYWIALLSLVLGISETGCVSKATSDARVKAAFFAGQQEAYKQMQQQQPRQAPAAAPSTVTMSGNVRTPSVPWTQDLTVAKAILSAGYTGTDNPKEIIIIRDGNAIQVDIEKLLNGADTPLLPGDTVQIR